MEKVLFDWVLSLPSVFATFGTWLISPLPYLDISPLAIFSFSGLTLIIGFLLVRLVVGG